MLLEALLTYFADELALVRRPSDGNGSLPPLYVDPRDGVPPPGSVTPATDAVLGALQTGGFPARVREPELRRDIIDFWIRTKTSARARELEEQVIRPSLIDKVDWTMGGLGINECLQWRALQRFSSDQDGYIYTTAYIFDRRAE